jgi:hypothetical protein
MMLASSAATLPARLTTLLALAAAGSVLASPFLRLPWAALLLALAGGESAVPSSSPCIRRARASSLLHSATGIGSMRLEARVVREVDIESLRRAEEQKFTPRRL